MHTLARLAVCGLIAMASSTAAAEVLEVSVRTYGPLMPLGPGESGRALQGVGPMAALDRHITAVEIVHTENRDVRTVVDGQPQTVEMAYYLVRVRLDRQGYEKLRGVQQAYHRTQQAARRMAGSAMLHIRVAETSQGDRFFLDEKAHTAELRLALHKQQLLPLLAAVQRQWQDEPGASTVNRWTAGDLDTK